MAMAANHPPAFTPVNAAYMKFVCCQAYRRLPPRPAQSVDKFILRCFASILGLGIISSVKIVSFVYERKNTKLTHSCPEQKWMRSSIVPFQGEKQQLRYYNLLFLGVFPARSCMILSTR